MPTREGGTRHFERFVYDQAGNVLSQFDANGNETPFSNEHIDPIRGLVRVRAQDGEELCWGGDCTPNPGSIHRAGGFQIERHE
ncbi:MAG: hypothetical protein ACERLB_08255 [Gammaproteobacteria bacterium]